MIGLGCAIEQAGGKGLSFLKIQLDLHPGISQVGSEYSRKRGNEMVEKIKKALDEVRPSLQADGGDVEFVSVENGIVKVRLTGACGGCPMSQMTLKQGIEVFVKKAVPEVLSVEAV